MMYKSIDESKNFICISSFNDDLDWFKEFDYPHIIFDKCCNGIKKQNISQLIFRLQIYIKNTLK